MEALEHLHDKYNVRPGPTSKNAGKCGSNSQRLIVGAETFGMLGNQEIIQRVTAESLVDSLQGTYQMNEDIENA